MMQTNLESNVQRTLTSLFIQTDKKFVSEQPRCLYEGPIKVIIGKEEADRAVEVLRKKQILGIDTETRPSFRKGESHQVSLLQISSKEVCFLFRLNRIGLTDSLVDLLSDENVLKVGLSLKDDLHALLARRNFAPKGFIDLQNVACEMGIKDMSLQKLYANVFHKRISKNARLSNWEAAELNETQQRYAATDAFTCIELYEKLSDLKISGNYILVENPYNDLEQG